ncbi:hypothetical protein JCGZ_00472 [Jatropha curcas]|uniref:X8 domain-containing protein n=1 Tax=Jatropha curcas TaxID=180498 RepID=A0A067L6E8_JATCU|nr:hypothetical protein JCGZ_00472 [Jatropha curcas]
MQKLHKEKSSEFCLKVAFHSMEPKFYAMKFRIFGLYTVISASFFLLSDTRLLPEQMSNNPETYNVPNLKSPLQPTYGLPYGFGSSFSPPPLESLPPHPLPVENAPPSLNSPSISSSPTSYLLPPSPTPPLSSNFPIETPPNNFAGPPTYSFGAPSPQYHGPSPPKFVLSPPIYKPPTPGVHPTPSVPPPPHKGQQFAVWCVAKPTVPSPIIQQALDYACGSGADCKSIQPNGPCFQPNTVIAHASYAFNSYWQKSKAAGGTCDFGGTAMLVTIDPSVNNCNFILN